VKYNSRGEFESQLFRSVAKIIAVNRENLQSTVF